MFLKICSSYSMLYIVVVWILGMCYGFVLLSSAAGQNGDIKLFVPGEEIRYNLHSTVLLDEKDQDDLKNVGFFISGQVLVQCIWGKTNDKVLKFQLVEPKLHIKSRKAPTPDGFVYHTSKLEDFQNGPFYVHWQNGKISEVLVNGHETLSLLNIKKGIASLFQFQLLDGTLEETDSSGTCSVEYRSLGPEKILKTKRHCKSALPYLKNPEISLDAIVTSSRTIDYDLDKNSRYFKRMRSMEMHIMTISSNNNFGSKLISDHLLDFVQYNPDKVTIESGDDARDVLDRLISSEGLHRTSLQTEKDNLPTDEDVKSFSDSVDQFRDQLKTDLLGKAASAKAFIKLVSIARKATREDVKKTLNSKKNKQILPQLFDILGASPSLQSYEAVVSKLDFTKENQLDNYERYLWSLSLGAHQNPDVIEKLYLQYTKHKDIPSKFNETMLLTLASMSYRLNRVTKSREQVTQKIEKLLLERLRASNGEQSYPLLRALKNLRSPTTVQDLLKKIKEGTSKEGALAWRAIFSLDRANWGPSVLKAARKAFLQLDRKYDTSSRTIASEILLESNPSDETLKEIIYHLASNDTVYEVKQYALQKIRMLAEDDLNLHQRVTKIIKTDEKLKNNYYVMNPRGLSTAIKRYFVKNQSGNGSLVSLQEINNAVVKRGVVNLLWDKESGSSELFSLGIFTSGLSSFISSETEEIEEEPEVASAGMELAVLGTQFRPFVFFSGQGELMGHVWSGTASERTTAYQALIMLHDHLEYIHLGSGFVMEVDLKGAASFDLAGKIEISLWGRNAQSLVEKCAGIFVTGSMKIDSSIVRSQVQFSASVEPQLKLNSDIDFSSSMKFCMRLSQMDALLRYNTYKIERIPGSKHKLRFNKYRKSSVPGMTYSLNRKNNEMCSAIHQ